VRAGAVGFKVVREAKIIAMGVAASVELADALVSRLPKTDISQL
jgi:hypothetical protein